MGLPAANPELDGNVADIMLHKLSDRLHLC